MGGGWLGAQLGFFEGGKEKGGKDTLMGRGRLGYEERGNRFFFFLACGMATSYVRES